MGGVAELMGWEMVAAVVRGYGMHVFCSRNPDLPRPATLARRVPGQDDRDPHGIRSALIDPLPSSVFSRE